MAQIHTRPLPKVSTSSLPGSATQSGGFSAPGGTPSWRSGASPSPTHTINPTPSTPLPPPPLDLEPRPLSEREKQLVKHLSRLQFFLATAPTRWMNNDGSSPATQSSYLPGSSSSPHPYLNRFPLPNGEHVSCVFWNGLYHITGTDIVRALIFRFEAFSRPVKNVKKFEEGVFSDLRNLKPGADACLEEPKSLFLDLLFRNGCIRTQKKQKVFYWFSVPHDRLFLDALERDLKREKMGLEPTTMVAGEPARSFRYDPNRGLYEQFAGKQPGIEESINMGMPVLQSEPSTGQPMYNFRSVASGAWDEASDRPLQPTPSIMASPNEYPANIRSPAAGQEVHDQFSQPGTANSVLFSRSLFEGSPAYKQRRKRSSKKGRRAGTAGTGAETEDSGSEVEGHSNIYSDTRAVQVGNPPFDSSVSYFAPDHHEGMGYNVTQLNGSTPQVITGAQAASPAMPAAHDPTQLYPPPTQDFSQHHAFSPQVMSSMSPSGRPSTTPESFATPTQAVNGSGKGFACPLISCGRLFKRLEHLKRHVRTHTQERPYECKRCSKRFSRSDNLTQHIKTHEKADRGERVRTEMSESTEDDGSYLEAEVDAMAMRGHRMWSEGSPNVLPPRSVRYSTHDGSTDYGISRFHPYVPRQGGYHAHYPSQPSGLSNQTYDWTGQSDYVSTGSQSGSLSIPKRHRSMTPHLPAMARPFVGGSTPADVGRGPHFAPPTMSRDLQGPFAANNFHRATSLDPSTLKAGSPMSMPAHLAGQAQVPNDGRFGLLTMGLSTSSMADSLAPHDVSSNHLQLPLNTYDTDRKDLTDEFTNWDNDG